MHKNLALSVRVKEGWKLSAVGCQNIFFFLILRPGKLAYCHHSSLLPWEPLFKFLTAIPVEIRVPQLFVLHKSNVIIDMVCLHVMDGTSVKRGKEITCFLRQLPCPITEKITSIIYLFLMILPSFWSFHAIRQKWLFRKKQAWDWFSMSCLEVSLWLGKIMSNLC